MKTYKFVYIATSDHYLVYFDGFVKSLENFCKDKIYKKVILLTDNIDYDISEYNNLENIEISVEYILHMPWPLVTLLKIHYISNYLDDDFDKLFYCNANFRFNSRDDIPEQLEGDKFIFTKVIKKDYYYNWFVTNPYDERYDYILGGLFGGSKTEVIKMCDFTKTYINELLYDNKIDFKHDESALNKYLSEIGEDTDRYTIINLQDYGWLDFECIEKDGKYIHHESGHPEINNLLQSNNDVMCKPICMNKK